MHENWREVQGREKKRVVLHRSRDTMAESGDAYLRRQGKVTPSGRQTCPENWSDLPHTSTLGEGHGDQTVEKLD